MPQATNLLQEKEYFLKNQFWALTISASFARAKVYPGKEAEAVKEDLKIAV